MPAPSFYVEAESVLRKYYEYRKNPEAFKVGRRQDLLLELFKRYEEIRNKYGKSVCQYTIMEAIVNQPAPSFYLTPKYAITFYYNAMRNKRLKARV